MVRPGEDLSLRQRSRGGVCEKRDGRQVAGSGKGGGCGGRRGRHILLCANFTPDSEIKWRRLGPQHILANRMMRTDANGCGLGLHYANVDIYTFITLLLLSPSRADRW